MIVELDLVSQALHISKAFTTVRDTVGDPNVVIYNAGYLEGRDLPPEQALLEHFPVDMFDTAMHIACRGPFLVAKEVLPAMRERGAGSFFFSNNAQSLRGRKRQIGQSLYYPRAMMRTLAQVLTEEYAEYGIHVANIVIYGTIDSPGTRALPRSQQHPELVINPVKIAEAFYYLHTQDNILLDARSPIDALRDQAELLRVSRRPTRQVARGVCRREGGPRPGLDNRRERRTGMHCGVMVTGYNQGDWGAVPSREDYTGPPTVSDAANMDDTLALGELVEPLSFDSIWATEHYGSAYSMQPNPLQYLAYWAWSHHPGRHGDGRHRRPVVESRAAGARDRHARYPAQGSAAASGDGARHCAA